MSNQWYDVETWQWTDDPSWEWGFTEDGGSEEDFSGLHQVFTDNTYVYTATTSGLGVIDIETGEPLHFIHLPTDDCTAVWASDNYVYYGSNFFGIRRFFKGCIETSPDLYGCLGDYATSPDIGSNNIKYIHGNATKLICCTAVGIDIIRRNTGYITNCYVSGAKKCFVTPKHDYYYYTVSGTSSWTLNCVHNNKSNWSQPDFKYTTGSGFLSDATNIKDIFVTEYTSTSGNYNTLFIATDIGVYVYDEGTTEYILFKNKNASGSYPIVPALDGDSNNFVAVWADLNTNIEKGKMYVGSIGQSFINAPVNMISINGALTSLPIGNTSRFYSINGVLYYEDVEEFPIGTGGAAFSMIDMNGHVLYDSHRIDKPGVLDEPLEQEDIADITVGA